MTLDKIDTALPLQLLIGFSIGLVAGLIVHATAGAAPWVEALTSYVTQPIGQIFLRLLFMLVIPLLFSALVTGIAEMGDIRSLKRIGIKTLVFTVVVSAISVVLALAVVNILKPGAGVDPDLAAHMLADGRENAQAIVAGGVDRPSAIDAFINIIPNNVVRAAADNDILAVMFFALVFGIGLLVVQTRASNQLQATIQGIFDVTMMLIGVSSVWRPSPSPALCSISPHCSAGTSWCD